MKLALDQQEGACASVARKNNASGPAPIEVPTNPVSVVLLISNLEYGGAQRQVVELANNLNASGHDAHVCCLSDYVPLSRELNDADRLLHIVAKRHKFDVTVVPRLAKLLTALDTDIVHTFLFDAEMAGRAASILNRKVAVIGSERNTDYVRRRLHSICLRATGRLFDAIIANSHAGKRFQERTLGIASERVFAVHNGVDTDKFKPQAVSRVREELGITPGAPVVAMFASFKKQKNHLMLFRVVQRVLEKLPEARFLCVGGALHQGLQSSGLYHREMLEAVESMGISRAVLAIGNRDDVIDVCNSADVTVLTSYREGTPNVLLESMACGVPVVATQAADNAIIIPDGRVGFVVAFDDDKTMADRLVEMLENPTRLEAMGSAARSWAESEFSLSSLARKTLAVYREVLARKDRNRIHASANPVEGGQGAEWGTAEQATSTPVSLLPCPYPYRAMLSVCSDLDLTPDRRVYWETTKFLNTTEETCMGKGVGLEVGNSLYFSMPEGQFSYWGTDDTGREMLRRLIHSGHIDVLHSYGDLAKTRLDAERALRELEAHNLRFEVWVDHSKAPTNFGADIMHGCGDLPGADAYHADLTLAHGVRFICRGRVTSMIGQDVRPSLGAFQGVWRSDHPIASARTVAKELAKHMLGKLGNSKYDIHPANRVLREVSLRNDARCMEFVRCNPHYRGVSGSDTASGVGDVITESFLSSMVRRGGACVLYCHLGKIVDPDEPLPHSSREAYRRLARRYHAGEILVLTTARLLRYLLARDRLVWEVQTDKQGLNIVIRTLDDPARGHSVPKAEDLAGLTFRVPKQGACRITDVFGTALPFEQIEEKDAKLLTIPFRALDFPDV